MEQKDQPSIKVTPMSLGFLVKLPLSKLDSMIEEVRQFQSLLEEARREVINRTNANKTE